MTKVQHITHLHTHTTYTTHTHQGYHPIPYSQDNVEHHDNKKRDLHISSTRILTHSTILTCLIRLNLIILAADIIVERMYWSNPISSIQCFSYCLYTSLCRKVSNSQTTTSTPNNYHNIWLEIGGQKYSKINWLHKIPIWTAQGLI